MSITSPRSFAWPIWAGFALTLATLAIVGLVSYRTTADFASSTIWVGQTHLVIETLLELEATVNAAESRQRGYLLTGDPYFRRVAVAEVAVTAERLIVKARKLIRDQNQQRRLELLRPLIGARLAIIDQILAVRDADGLQASVRYIVAHRPWEDTATVRQRIGEVIAEEHRLLDQRDSDARATARTALNVVVYGTLAALVFVLFAGVFIQRALAKLRDATFLAEQRAAELQDSQQALQRQVEQTNRGRAQVSRLLAEAPDAMVAINESGQVMLFNALAESVFGYTAREMLGKPIELLLPERFRSPHEGHRRGFFADPRPRLMGEGLDLFARRKDGTEFPVDVRLSPIDTDMGILVLSTIRDLTERLRAQQTQARLASLVENSQYAIVTHAVGGVVLTWNRGAERLYGFEASEVIGRAVPEIVAPQASELMHSRYGSMIEERRGQEFETVLTRKDGSVVEVAISMSPIHDARGKVVAYSTLSNDITERKRAERALLARSEELASSNAELEQFAYVASHDLQEPLRMVASYVELLARRYKGRLDSDADEFINFAVDGAARMKGLINDLLNYSRAGRGKPVGPVRFGEVVQRALANLVLNIEETGAIVTCDAMPIVNGDESQLTELVQNLVANAIKFCGENPPAVHISAARQGSSWLISVRDNGIGISSEYAERIFVMFQRLHGPSDYPGTGIGLAICKRIVERHGGRIWVESEPGNGANFCFTIPAIEEIQHHASPA